LRRLAQLGWSRPALAIVAGVLWALAFPLPGWSGLVWIAPGLLLAAGFDLRPGAAFRIGYFAGVAHHLVALRWLLHIPFPAGAIAGWLALTAYCALFPGLWLLLASRFIRSATATEATAGWRPCVDALLRISETRRQILWAWLAAVWAALELVRGQFLGGFPWNMTGVTLWRNLPLMQTASVTGVYGLSFLICWVSVALAGGVAMLVLRSDRRFAWTAALRIPLIALLLIMGAGLSRVMTRRPPPPTTALALVQPSISQRLIWDDAANPARFEKVLELTRQALATHPDALLWPEGSMPDLSEEQFATVVAATRQAGAAWIFGTAYGRLVDGKPEHYNAAILVGPGGQVEERYHKQRLVIFGEFIPFENILPFMKWLTPIGSSFTPGRGPAAFRFGTNRSVNASPMICFEDVFPHHTRSHVTPETDFLLELTNNGWFGESSAQWQHCAAAALRAVENGVPLVRCANNGLTCWLDEFGGLHDVLQSASGSVYDAGFLSTRVPLRPDGEPRPLTFYNRHGDVFGWLCFAAMIIGTASTFRR
jgi:apolipoprotein N-acyltransferase